MEISEYRNTASMISVGMSMMTTSNWETVEVFRENFREEEARLLLLLSRYKTIAFDTEFPGVLDHTPRDADDARRYHDLKSNVERTKLIQVGFTVFDSSTGLIAGVWQFNMSGFSPQRHHHSPDSIRLLQSNGIDFAANFAHGVRMAQLVGLLRKIRHSYGPTIQWVTFHGLYDAAYLLVSLARNRRLPPEILGFARSAAEFFSGGIFDLKFMAGEFNYMGLERLAAEVGETRDHGRAHQAGSDSLLTAKVFLRAVRKMRYSSGNCLLNYYKGRLYGLSVPIIKVNVVPASANFNGRPPTRCYAYVIPFHRRVIVPNLQRCHGLLLI